MQRVRSEYTSLRISHFVIFTPLSFTHPTYLLFLFQLSFIPSNFVIRTLPSFKTPTLTALSVQNSIIPSTPPPRPTTTDENCSSQSISFLLRPPVDDDEVKGAEEKIRIVIQTAWNSVSDSVEYRH